MTDNQLIALLISTLQTGLTAQSIIVGIQQAFQPTQQGAPSAPCILLHKLGDKRYGFAQKTVVNTGLGIGTQTEAQTYETTYQVDAIAIQDPSDVNSVTASDYVNNAAMILCCDASVQTFAANEVFLLRVTDVKHPFFEDEKARHEASPSFEFTLRHTRTIVNPVPFTGTVIGTPEPVN